MQPAVQREVRAGWVTLAGAGVLCLGVIGWTWSTRSEVRDQLSTVQQRFEELTKSQAKSKDFVVQDLKARVEEQRKANKVLHATIRAQEGEVGFKHVAPFVIPVDDPEKVKHPGSKGFSGVLIDVREKLRQSAHSRVDSFDESLGFSQQNAVVPDDQAAYQLSMLQVVQKAVSIALRAPTGRLTSLRVLHPESLAVDCGPAGRAPLLREYPLTLEIQATLDDILFVLHELSVFDQTTDFPLVLRYLKIDGDNKEEHDHIKPLRATFKLSAMEFLSDEARDQIARKLPGGRAHVSRATMDEIRLQTRPRP